MKPDLGAVHVNRPLTNISIAYIQGATNFVAAEVFPVIPVNNQSDRYFKYNKSDFRRDEMKKRAPGAESAGGGYAIDNTPSYYCDLWAYHKDVADVIRSNSDAPLNPDRDATIFCTQKALIRREKIFAANFLTTSVWATDVAGVAASPSGSQVLQWNDAASTPIDDIQAGTTAILRSTGFKPNRLVLGYEVFAKLKNHPDIIDRVKFTQGIADNQTVRVNQQALAYLFDVERVLVMEASEDTSAEGSTTEANAFIGGKKALLCYAAPQPSLQLPSAGYTFSWTGYTGAGPDGNRVKRFRMDALASDRVEIEMALDMKVVASDCGYFFNSVVA